MVSDHTVTLVFSRDSVLSLVSNSTVPPFRCHQCSLAAEPWLTLSTGTHREMCHWTGTNRGRKINYFAHTVQSTCVCVLWLLFVSKCVSHLRRSFPFLLTDTEVLQAEAGVETLWAHFACFVVQSLWTLCADGLQKDGGEKERQRWEAAHLLTVNCLKENFSICVLTSVFIPFDSTSHQSMPIFPLCHLCSPLHRPCSDVCAWWNWSSRYSLYKFASLSPFSWNSSGKKTTTQESCVKVISLNQKECLAARLASSFVYQAAYLPFLPSINKRHTGRQTPTQTHYPSLKDN